MRERVCIGVAVHAEPTRLRETLAFLRRHTDPAHRVVLLPDGPDEPTTTALAADPELTALDQWATIEPRGTAACFNRLAERTDAGTVVLLEDGALVGPRWLEFLLAALDRPGCGLAGPSTNTASNAQAIAPHARVDEPAVRREAALALHRFGFAVRTLEPLYNLADFCYAVRREVIDSIGPAEEGYGLGPGWEMDYNIRAARAGFRGVWVGASYVCRSAPTARQRATAADQREHSHQLYQDRFCGLRLRGETTLYQPRCGGDRCEHFAPDDTLPPLRPRGPLEPIDDTAPGPTPAQPSNGGDCSAPPSSAPARPSKGGDGSGPPDRTPPQRRMQRSFKVGRKPVAASQSKLTNPATHQPGNPAPITSRSGSTTPLVSCIMPTRSRTDFALQAVRYFQRQDYPNTELVIVEDGPPTLADALPADPRIRLVPGDGARSIGALRNIACHHAEGEIIIQWDDDDWHGPRRVSSQSGAIRDGTADITALRDALFFNLPNWQFGRFDEQQHRRLFVRDVHGGTLAFRRSVWEHISQYPNRSLAEDAAFLDHAVGRGATLRVLRADGLFVYLRHDSNSWRLRNDEYRGWQPRPEPAFPPADREFYARRSTAAPRQAVGARQPLVSCIMPTLDRRQFLPQAIEYFQRQDYPNKELVILDDGADGVADLVPDDPAIRYQRLDHRVVLGAKRNLACEIAAGQVIAHWDDDDWHAPNRLSVQVDRLLASGHELSGSRALRFYEPATVRAWRYEWPRAGRIWAAGPTLCYSRELWRRSPFPEVATGEDTRFVWSNAVTAICDVGDADVLVAIIHRHNTVPKTVHGANWSRVPSSDVERLLGDDLLFYQGARCQPQR